MALASARRSCENAAGIAAACKTRPCYASAWSMGGRVLHGQGSERCLRTVSTGTEALAPARMPLRPEGWRRSAQSTFSYASAPPFPWTSNHIHWQRLQPKIYSRHSKPFAPSSAALKPQPAISASTTQGAISALVLIPGAAANAGAIRPQKSYWSPLHGSSRRTGPRCPQHL